jgi:hypothetical protein
MLLIRFENIFVIALCIMERPAAMLAPVELSLLVDGIAGKGKRRPLSAFGAADSLALLFFYRILYHFSFLVYKYNKFPLKERQSRGTYR